MMRKKIFGAALIGSLMLVVIAATANAQLAGTAIRAEIPFDFSAMGRTLPAGNYEIRRITDEPNVLLVSNVNNPREHVTISTEPVQSLEGFRRTELVFNKYSDRYFLHEILPAGEETGQELLQSRQERNLKRELASNHTSPERVALAAY
jgi:hypothetical protein